MVQLTLAYLDLFIVASDDHANGTVTSWILDPMGGNLTSIDITITEGSAANCVVTPDGQFVAVANVRKVYLYTIAS